jgi:hypothetical protein
MKHFIGIAALAALATTGLYADGVNIDIVQSGGVVTANLDPAGGILYGNPGDTVGWGFTLTTDANYTVYIEASDFCPTGQLVTSPCTPNYTDLIGFQNGVYINAGDPEQVQDFDPVNELGFGSYVVPGAAQTGQLYLEYFLGDSQGNPIDGTDTTIAINAEVAPEIVATPEPALWPISGLAIAALFSGKRRPEHKRPA